VPKALMYQRVLDEMAKTRAAIEETGKLKQNRSIQFEGVPP
jgi:hypothetical protein